jgi:hypothetical protein
VIGPCAIDEEDVLVDAGERVPAESGRPARVQISLRMRAEKKILGTMLQGSRNNIETSLGLETAGVVRSGRCHGIGSPEGGEQTCLTSIGLLMLRGVVGLACLGCSDGGTSRSSASGADGLTGFLSIQAGH